jgi:HlyD family secretion protein
MKFKSFFSRRLLLGLLGLALLGALLFVLLRAGPLAPTRITVTTVASAPVAPALFGIGTVEARRAYLMGPTVPGRVLQVLADVGEHVKAGQLLAEMDPVDLAQRLAALQASLARAGSAQAAAQAQVQDALARQALARTNTRRNVELAEKHFISAGALEARQQEQASTDAAVQAAQANLDGARQELVRLQAEQAGLRQQRDTLRLLAPVDGVVTAREAEAGSTVVAGQAVLRLIDPASLWVKTRFDQGRSSGLASGLPARIVLRSNPGAPLTGKVARLEWLSDSVTEERVAQIVFDALPAGVTQGELAEVTLQLPSAASALVVPNASLKRRGEQTGVWRLQQGSLRFAPLRLGASGLDGRVQVLDGLQAGDQVVVYSEKELSESTRFKVVDALAGAAK